MGVKKLQMEEKSRALTSLEKGDSVITVAKDIGSGGLRGAERAEVRGSANFGGPTNLCLYQLSHHIRIII